MNQNQEAIGKWKTIGKITIGEDERHECYDCGEDAAGYYFEVENKETAEVRTLCEDCQKRRLGYWD